MRKGSDVKQIRKVIDIRDMKLPLKHQFEGRKEAYDFYEFQIADGFNITNGITDIHGTNSNNGYGSNSNISNWPDN
jgi:hypothetical protein